MNTAGPKIQLLSWLQGMGIAIEDIRECVVADDGETITVDTSHAAYPKTPARRSACNNCGSVDHAVAACPIPAHYDGDYRRDSGGTAGCNCA